MNLRKDIVRIVLVTIFEFLVCAGVGVLFALLLIANLDAALPPAP